MATTVTLTRKKDSAEVSILSHKFFDAIAKKQVNSVDDIIIIEDERYIFSSVTISGGSGSNVGSRLYKDGSKIKLQYEVGGNYYDTGDEWAIPI